MNAMDKVQILISLLAGLSVMAVGGAILMARLARGRRLKPGSATVAGDPMPQQSTASFGPKFAGMIENVGTAVASGKASVTLREQLTQAGYHAENSAAVYIGAKMLLGGVGLLGRPLWSPIRKLPGPDPIRADHDGDGLDVFHSESGGRVAAIGAAAARSAGICRMPSICWKSALRPAWESTWHGTRSAMKFAPSARHLPTKWP